MSEEIASHSEESPEIERDAETESLFADFDLNPQSEKKDIEFPDVQENVEDPDLEAVADPAPTDSKKRVVKFNKEDREIDESEVDGLLQMGLALPKQRERATEYEKALDRAAKLAGFNTHEDFIANLDRMEQHQVKAQEDAFKNAKQRVIDDLIDSGVSEEVAIEYAENNPLVQQAQRALLERDASKMERDSQSQQQAIKSQWDEVFSTFSDIEKRDIVFNGSHVVFAGDTAPEWLTPEVLSRLQSGYKPIDAITLSNLDKIQTKTKKATEQKLIKQQQLGNRAGSQGNTADMPDEPTLLPAQMSLAAEFGVDIKGVVRQQKLLNSRR